MTTATRIHGVMEKRIKMFGPLGAASACRVNYGTIGDISLTSEAAIARPDPQ